MCDMTGYWTGATSLWIFKRSVNKHASSRNASFARD